MNETMKNLETRRSIRNFNDKPVPKEILQQIVEAGTYAPTGMGKQSPIILAITNKKILDELRKQNASVMGRDCDPFYGASVVLLVVADKSVPTAVYDGSCVIDNMLNAAWSLGVGSIWIHRAKEEVESDFGKKLLADTGVVGDYIGVGHVALGYFDGENPQPKPRKENYVVWVE